MASPESPRRGLRFSLRSLLFLVTFVAILLAMHKTLGPGRAWHIADDLWPECFPELLMGAGFYLSYLLVPLGAVAVPIYVWMGRRSPSFLALFAAGAVAATGSFLLVFLHWTKSLVGFSPYYLLTMLAGSVLALVECRIKRLPWTAVWISLAALVCSLSFFCFMRAVRRMGSGG